MKNLQIIFILLFLVMINRLTIAQQCNVVSFKRYSIQYNNNMRAKDELISDSTMQINDFGLKVTYDSVMTILKIKDSDKFKSLKQSEKLLYDGAPNDIELFKNMRYDNAMHCDYKSSDIMKSDVGFIPHNDTNKNAVYMRIINEKKVIGPINSGKYIPGFCPNGVYYKYKDSSYFITNSFGSAFTKLLIFQITDKGYFLKGYFGIPGRDLKPRLGNKIINQKADNLQNFSSTSGGAYFTILSNGQVLIPVNLKCGNLKGIQLIDLNRFIDEGYQAKGKEKYTTIYASHLNNAKETADEYVVAAMPYKNSKFWLTTSTAKIILLDIANTTTFENTCSFEMNDTNNNTIKPIKDSMLYKLKASFIKQFEPNNKNKGNYWNIHNGNNYTIDSFLKTNNDYLASRFAPPDSTIITPAGRIFNFFKECEWRKHKKELKKMNLLKCYNPINKIKACNCTNYFSDIGIYKFQKAYLINRIFYSSSKFLIHNPFCINCKKNNFQNHIIQNSFSLDDEGAAYINTNFMMTKFEYNDTKNEIILKWHDTYDNGFLELPGHVKASSGTTPTVFGNYVTITDNAFPSLHLYIYNTDSGTIAGKTEVFKNKQGACENSIVVLSEKNKNIHHLILGNSFGYWYAFDEINITHGGLDKYTFNGANLLPDENWKGLDIDIKTATPKLSPYNGGIVYAYNKNIDGIKNEYADWQLTAIDFKSGHVIYNLIPSMVNKEFKDSYPGIAKSFTTGKNDFSKKIFDNIWGTFSLDPYGNLNIATLRGFIHIPNSQKTIPK